MVDCQERGSRGRERREECGQGERRIGISREPEERVDNHKRA